MTINNNFNFRLNNNFNPEELDDLIPLPEKFLENAPSVGYFGFDIENVPLTDTQPQEEFMEILPLPEGISLNEEDFQPSIENEEKKLLIKQRRDFINLQLSKIPSLLTKKRHLKNALQQSNFFEACKRLTDVQKLELPRRALDEMLKYNRGLSESKMAFFFPENNIVRFENNNSINFVVKQELDFPEFYYLSKENKYKDLSDYKKENIYSIGKMLKKIRALSGMKNPERLDHLIKSMTEIPGKNDSILSNDIKGYLFQLDKI